MRCSPAIVEGAGERAVDTNGTIVSPGYPPPAARWWPGNLPAGFSERLGH